MILDSNRILQILLNKGVDTFFHANTVRTSCTFLADGHLLSRQNAVGRGLAQTTQGSDDKDQKFGVFDDIFLDGVDIHERGGKRRAPNEYGPVLFMLDIRSVLTDPLVQGALRITRDNPYYWTQDQTDAQRYFTSAEEFDQSYRRGDFFRMLTFRISGGRLPLAAHLRQIRLDDPRIPNNSSGEFDAAYAALQEAAARSRTDVRIERRQCQEGCVCLQNYSRLWGSRFRATFE